MQHFIKEHKTPVVVTTVGLLVAIGLATAPALLAESETDIRAAENAAVIKKLVSTVDENSTGIQQQLDAYTSNSGRKFSSLENQIQTLNKATTRLNLRQRSIQEPSGTIRSSIQSLAKNADARLINLEKAIVRLHKKQKGMGSDTQAATQSNDNKDTSIDELRLENLEKAVKNLHLKLVRSSSNSAPQTAPQSAAQPAPQPAPQTDQSDINKRMDALEIALRRSQNQRLLDTPGQSIVTSPNRRDLELETWMKNLESSVARLVIRLDQLENAYLQRTPDSRQRYDPVVDQLFEIRNTVDTLLNEMSR